MGTVPTMKPTAWGHGAPEIEARTEDRGAEAGLGSQMKRLHEGIFPR